MRNGVPSDGSLLPNRERQLPLGVWLQAGPSPVTGSGVEGGPDALVYQQRGVNPTSVEEIHLHCGDSTTLQEGETLCLVNGLYPYRIRFEQGSHSPKKTLPEFFSPRRALKEGDGKAQASKRPKASSPPKDVEDDDDDDDSVVKKLKQLQETAAQAQQKCHSSQQTLSKLAPHPCDSWEDQGKLLVFTKKGVVPSAKVRDISGCSEGQF